MEGGHWEEEEQEEAAGRWGSSRTQRPGPCATAPLLPGFIMGHSSTVPNTLGRAQTRMFLLTRALDADLHTHSRQTAGSVRWKSFSKIHENMLNENLQMDAAEAVTLLGLASVLSTSDLSTPLHPQPKQSPAILKLKGLKFEQPRKLTIISVFIYRQL